MGFQRNFIFFLIDAIAVDTFMANTENIQQEVEAKVQVPAEQPTTIHQCKW